MITKEIVENLASIYLEGCEFIVSRSNGGWPTSCGWQLSIVSETQGNMHTIFIHDNNTESQARSKVIRLAEYGLNPV